jgi:histidine triad (HIT) family protein
MCEAERRLYNSARVPQEECVFCKIVARKLPGDIVYEDGDYVAFLDHSPFSAGHTLVCPRRHGETVWDMNSKEIGGLFMLASRISRAIVAAVGADGFRFVQNNGEAANQVVAHVHVHVIPVSLEDKGKFMGRKNIPPEEIKRIGERIRAQLKATE